VITRAAKDSAQTALITRSYNTIHRGDELTPYFASSEELAVRTVEKPLYGWIVASKQPKLELVEGDVVYIDLGDVDHIRPGHVFHVLRRGTVIEYPVADGKKKKRKKTEKIKLPDELIARLVVVRTQQKTSTAVIVQTRLSVYVGDEVTTVTE
jgi:DNA recombination-dependent growth factor C